MADKYLGYHSKLKLQTGVSPVVWTPIASVASVSGPGMSRTVVDNTTLDAPSNYRTKQFGMRDAAELTLEIMLDPDEPTHNDTPDGLFDLYNEDSTPLRNWQLEISNSGQSMYFAAAVTGYEPNIGGVDDNVALTATLTISGPLTFDAATVEP